MNIDTFFFCQTAWTSSCLRKAPSLLCPCVILDQLILLIQGRPTVPPSVVNSPVCVYEYVYRVCVDIGPESRHFCLLTETWPLASHPGIFPGSLSASRQHLHTRSRFTAPWRRSAGREEVDEEGRAGTWGGDSVGQLFAVVLTSYFTRK